jgi:hypothetical protein
MAHFAELDQNGKVLQVIFVNNEDILDENGEESEWVGILYCKDLFGGNWVQTSRSGSFRRSFAVIGGLYSSEHDVFLRPNPFPSWTLNEDKFIWEPPVEKPSDKFKYEWDEKSLSWVEIPFEKMPPLLKARYANES